MKLINYCSLALLLLSISGLWACSDDNDEIYFTQDEIVEGDILTGKQLSVGNSVTVYTNMSDYVNVQGAKGKISAVSANAKIASVQVLNAAYEARPISDKSILVKGTAVGNTVVTVTDEDGHYATLNIEVKDEKALWSPVAEYTKISLIEDDVLITGATPQQEAAIRTDLLVRKTHEHKFLLMKWIPAPFITTFFRMYVYDAGGNLLYELRQGYRTMENNVTLYAVDKDGNLLKSYTFTEKEEYGTLLLCEDVTEDYKELYPDVKVEVRMVVKK